MLPLWIWVFVMVPALILFPEMYASLLKKSSGEKPRSVLAVIANGAEAKGTFGSNGWNPCSPSENQTLRYSESVELNIQSSRGTIPISALPNCTKNTPLSTLIDTGEPGSAPSLAEPSLLQNV